MVPGGIEPHAHLSSLIGMHPEGRLFTLGPEEDTLGMAFGGVTTHIDLSSSIRRPTCRPRWRGGWNAGRANPTSTTAFISRWAERCRLRIFEQMPEAIQEGFPSFKIFTNEVLPPHPKRLPFKLDFGRIGYRDGASGEAWRNHGRACRRRRPGAVQLRTLS